MAGNTTHHRPNSGPAMRFSRSSAKPFQPRRCNSMCANRPAIRKKVVMRNRWMTKNAPEAKGEPWLSLMNHMGVGA